MRKSSVKIIFAAVLVLISMIFSVVTVSASNEIVAMEMSGHVTWMLFKNGSMIINGSGILEGVANYYEGGAKNSPWYLHKDIIKNIIIGDNVSGIGKYAFCECKNLETVLLPARESFIIENAAFEKCYSLKAVYRNGTMPILGAIDLTNVHELSSWSFADCYLIRNVIVSSQTTSIGKSVFDNCIELKNIYGVPGSYAERFASENGYKFYDSTQFSPASIVLDLPSVVPVETSAKPVTTTKAPETTTRAPETTPKAPETTTRAPETTTKTPETTPKSPESTIPIETEPQEPVTIAPPESEDKPTGGGVIFVPDDPDSEENRGKGDYVIYKPDDEEEKEEEKESDDEETGELDLTSFIIPLAIFAVALLVVIIVVIVVLAKSKRRNNQ